MKPPSTEAPLGQWQAAGIIGRRAAPLALAVLALSLCACGPGRPNGWETTSSVEDAGDIKFYPSDESYRRGVEQFNRGHYGLSEQAFRDAVEKAPRDAGSWLGLAASYDRLRRFDLADRAYGQAINLTGETPQILNNRGYSFMLRGNLVTARALFEKALQIEPENPVTLNNIMLLNGSSRYIVRPEEP
ncbi:MULTISPECIES: tetratricopeptide repeat protein [Rhodomicrobium]|uniref:tetratricopeptide repeat protein n=1 Tax=Rhodomicrobium TaxID=1068 RepID=UPI001FD8C183|nr:MULTISPECIES: tetratricopeptide repeat protein [Rhodomicrobium]